MIHEDPAAVTLWALAVFGAVCVIAAAGWGIGRLIERRRH